MADIAERVYVSLRIRHRIGFQREFQYLLVIIVSRMKAHRHGAAMHWLLVGEPGDMLDCEFS